MNVMDDEKDDFRKLQFLIEQLQLITLNKYNRNYSPQLTVLSFMINSASSAAHTVLREENILCLPSTNTLRKVSRRMSDADLQTLFARSHGECLMLTAWTILVT